MTCVSFAQKKEIAQAKDNIKSRSNLEKSEKTLRSILSDSIHNTDIKLFQTLADVMRTQYEVANEKFYLKEKVDTSSFFNVTRRMFLAYESLDSIESLPDDKGRIKIKSRKKNASYLSAIRRNLYNGGLFFIGRGDYMSAYSMMDTYLDCNRQPLFSDIYNSSTIDTTSDNAAFWTLFCGYMLNRPDSALKYKQLALADKAQQAKTLRYLSEVYMLKRDTANYVDMLLTGFEEGSESEYFFTRLMDYYNDSNKLDSAMIVINKGLARDKDNGLYLFAKSNVLLNEGHYQECIELSDMLLARNDSIADVYYNAGVSYINMALSLESVSKSHKKTDTKVIDYYRKALPYLEKYRSLVPDNPEKWAQSLYNVYYKLNMGRQFEEMSKILMNMRK
ncbi:MAG: tetratricopeptide repeat protein [Prevotella sp.]